MERRLPAAWTWGFYGAKDIPMIFFPSLTDLDRFVRDVDQVRGIVGARQTLLNQV